MGLRAWKSGDTLRIDYSITLDGELLEPITPVYQVLHRQTQAVVASGTMTPDASPALFHASASVPISGDLLRVVVSITYAGLGVESETHVEDAKTIAIEVEDLPVEVDVDDLAEDVEVEGLGNVVEVELVDDLELVELADALEVVQLC